MKKFDLSLAKQGHPVCTRNGLSVKILDFDFKNKTYCIIAKIQDKENYESIMCFTKEGKRYNLETPDNNDLFMLSEKKEGWINLYKDKEIDIYCTGASVYSTKEEAQRKRRLNGEYLATIKIEWEE